MKVRISACGAGEAPMRIVVTPSSSVGPSAPPAPQAARASAARPVPEARRALRREIVVMGCPPGGDGMGWGRSAGRGTVVDGAGEGGAERLDRNHDGDQHEDGRYHHDVVVALVAVADGEVTES